MQKLVSIHLVIIMRKVNLVTLGIEKILEHTQLTGISCNHFRN